MGAFSYGWNQRADDVFDQEIDPNNPTGAGGAIGSQPLSQTGGSGAGLTEPGFTDPANQYEIQPPEPTGGAGAAGSLTGTPTAPTGMTPTATPAQPTYDFGDLLNKIQTATDPQQAAIQKDQLSRQLYSTLSDQGHDVKWDGDNLIVDGRPYVVGGGTGQMFTEQQGTATPASAPSSAPQAGWWAPTNQGFLDWATKNFGADANAFVKIDPAQFQQILARYTQETGNRADYIGGPSGDQVNFGQGIQDALTSSGQIWNNESTGAGGPGGSRPSGGGGGGYTPGGGGWTPPTGAGGWTPPPPSAPVLPTWQAPPGYQGPEAPTGQSAWEDSLRTMLGQARPDVTLAGLQGQTGDPMLGGELGAWRPQGGGYVPGEIGMDDVEGMRSYEQMLADMGQGQEGSKALLDKIIANPESLNQQTTDTMKTQMKDTLAAQQQQEEEDLRGFGAASGISDSGWLAAQRAGSRRGRDIAAAKGAGDIDIEAARTNMADRRAAAGLGLQAGEQRRANVQAASAAQIAKVAAKGDRLQLRESVKQEAAKLRISEDQVMSNFVQGKQDALMKKYGIDLGASVDIAKLNEQSQEFREDLMQKMASLEKSLEMQKYGIDTSAATSRYGTDVGSATSRYGTDVGAAMSKYGVDVGAGTSRYATDVNARLSDAQREQLDRQFAANLGLDYDKFNQLRDQDQWKRMQDLYGSAG